MASQPASRFEITYVQADYGLRAHVSGINGDQETTLAYWRDIAAQVRRLRPKAVLVVDDMDGEPPPPEELLTFVLSMKGEGMEGIRIAYVERDTLHIPKVELAGLLANEHGFDARIFDREQAALAWLRYGER